MTVQGTGSRSTVGRVDHIVPVGPHGVAAALDFATRAHGDQKYGTEPYRVHLDEVMAGCRRMGFTSDLHLMAAALHDVIEDTSVGRAGLEKKFGPEVARVVKELSHDRAVETVDYLAAMSDAAFSVKLGDRLANVERMGLLENAPDRAAYLLAKYGPEMAHFEHEADRRGLQAPFGILAAAMAKTTTAIRGAVSAYELQQGVDRVEAKQQQRLAVMAEGLSDGSSGAAAFVAKMAGKPSTANTSSSAGVSPLVARILQQAPGGLAPVDPVTTHRTQLRSDLKIAMDTLSTLPPALTFFGGARITKTDPYYAISMELGRLLADQGVPPRTGAGPGIMQSVPEGYVARRKERERDGVSTGPAEQLREIGGVADGASLDDTRTQGFNIKLPHEQKLNPVIEVAKEIQLFPFRKLALYENARGVVTFPGGFGTLDELFEIWNLAATGKLTDPIAAVGVEFWAPMLKALEQVAVKDRQLITPKDCARLFVSDDPQALLDHMLTSSDAPKGFETPPAQLSATLLAEVDVVTKGLRTLRTAVAFLGGETLAKGDPTLDVARALASHIAGQGAAVRVADHGTAATTVLDAAAAAGADSSRLQAVLWAGDGLPAATANTTTTPVTTTTTAATTAAATATTFSERIPHKELLLRSAEAYVVLPSGLKGLDEFATVLCQIQNDKLPMRPLVLVGRDYWQPLLDAWKSSMLSGERQLISPEDMDLVTVVDTVEEAKAALNNLR